MKVLTIEQMTKLKELGVDVKPKELCLVYSRGGWREYRLKYQKLYYSDDIKAFSLQDVIELLTDEVEEVIVSVNNEDYYIKCWEYKHYEENELKKIHFVDIKQILNACYEMILWVAENGYLKTK